MIKTWDYLAEYMQERDEILQAVDRVFQSGQLILGSEVKRFESAFASCCGTRYGVGVDNATNGLVLAMVAAGVRPGDEVITVANTAVPTVSAIAQAGATPRFVDIRADDYLMEVEAVEAAVTPRTKCLLPVHLYGQCVNMRALRDVARRHNLVVIEDCAQAHGAAQDGSKAGSMSDLAVFSFYPTKPLGAYGDGGIVVTDSAELDARLRRLRFYGMDRTYYAEELGYNSRLDEVHAAVLFCKLSRLNTYLQQRRAVAARYGRLLASTSLKLPTVAAGNEHAYYLYVVQHPERDRILAELKKKDIVLTINYPWPIHTMRGFAYLGWKEGDLPRTEAAAKAIFSLPMYPTLSESDQQLVCEAIGDALREPINS